MDSTLYWLYIVSTLIAKRVYFQFVPSNKQKQHNMCNLMKWSKTYNSLWCK
jgi:hypothetical protein